MGADDTRIQVAPERRALPHDIPRFGIHGKSRAIGCQTRFQADRQLGGQITPVGGGSQQQSIGPVFSAEVEKRFAEGVGGVMGVFFSLDDIHLVSPMALGAGDCGIHVIPDNDRCNLLPQITRKTIGGFEKFIAHLLGLPFETFDENPNIFISAPIPGDNALLFLLKFVRCHTFASSLDQQFRRGEFFHQHMSLLLRRAFQEYPLSRTLGNE